MATAPRRNARAAHTPAGCALGCAGPEKGLGIPQVPGCCVTPLQTPTKRRRAALSAAHSVGLNSATERWGEEEERPDKALFSA